MPVNFIDTWKIATGQTDDSALGVSITEISKAFDGVVPLVGMGGGFAVPGLGVLIASALQADDGAQPLYLLRPGPTNVFLSTVLPSLQAACSQLSAQVLQGVTPTPATAQAAWAATPAFGLNTNLDLTMAQYLGTVPTGIGGPPHFVVDDPPTALTILRTGAFPTYTFTPTVTVNKPSTLNWVWMVVNSSTGDVAQTSAERAPSFTVANHVLWHVIGMAANSGGAISATNTLNLTP